MNEDRDAYGKQLLAQYHSKTPTAEIIERDDGLIDFGSDAGLYFTEYEEWSPIERQAINLVKGKVLDIGCGAGRHALYLQKKGFDVTGIDNSPGAIEVCRLRGLRNALVRPIDDVDEFAENFFDTVIMFGNNFGLFGSADNAVKILKKLDKITTKKAQIIAGTLNPYKTDDLSHLKYHEFNRQRGRMPGQTKIRIIYDKSVGDWFDYLFISPEEMNEIIARTDWRIREIIAPEQANYFAVIEKKFM